MILPLHAVRAGQQAAVLDEFETGAAFADAPVFLHVHLKRSGLKRGLKRGQIYFFPHVVK
jgi:hypothetical protein